MDLGAEALGQEGEAVITDHLAVERVVHEGRGADVGPRHEMNEREPADAVSVLTEFEEHGGGIETQRGFRWHVRTVQGHTGVPHIGKEVYPGT